MLTCTLLSPSDSFAPRLPSSSVNIIASELIIKTMARVSDQPAEELSKLTPAGTSIIVKCVSAEQGYEMLS